MFTVHTLGALDLVFVSVAASSYFVVDTAADPKENRTDEYVELRSSDGARLAYRSRGEIDLPLVIIPFGDTLDIAETRRTAIETVLLDAANTRSSGVIVTYVEKDASNAVAKTWRLLGGTMDPVTTVPGAGRIRALQGKYVAPCVVNLVLSKN